MTPKEIERYRGRSQESNDPTRVKKASERIEQLVRTDEEMDSADIAYAYVFAIIKYLDEKNL